MADGHGGYRRPANPAPVSGPGAHSKRTDGQVQAELPDAQYGEGQEFRSLQQAAPLSTGTQTAPGAPNPMASVVGLGEPSMQPDTPITAGASMGAGPGPESLGMEDLDKQDADEFARLRPMLIRRAMRDDTPKSVKTLIRQMLSK